MTKNPIDLLVDEYNRRQMQDIELARSLAEAGMTSTDMMKLTLPLAYANEMVNMLSAMERGNGLFETKTMIAKKETLGLAARKRLKQQYQALNTKD